jgi:hypothetical protein
MTGFASRSRRTQLDYFSRANPAEVFLKIGGERGVNTPTQATVSQRSIQSLEYLYQQNQGRNAALKNDANR